MLLLTDNLVDGNRLKKALDIYQPCLVLPVSQARKRAATHLFIICSSGSFAASSDLFRDALDYHRHDPNIPVIFLVDATESAEMDHAKKLGATGVFPRDIPIKNLIFSLKLYKNTSAKSKPPHGDGTTSRTQESIETVGKSLSGLFKDAASGKAPSASSIDQGAKDLISSIRNTDVKEWVEIVRTYDDFTYQHCLLVAGLVATFSIRLGLSFDMQHCLAQAALVHDIGKALIPRSILNKNGPLTGPEQEIMRTHPLAGYKMLSRHQDIHPTILDVVLHHHEMVDGSGYPDRLKSSQISEFVRITAVCDVYAALIERRPYRAPMPPTQARGILFDMSSKLDVDFVKAFDQVACGL